MLKLHLKKADFRAFSLKPNINKRRHKFAINYRLLLPVATGSCIEKAYEKTKHYVLEIALYILD